MRSEFQDVFKDAYDHWIDDACSHRYNASKSLALQVWQHQQSKIDELQKNINLLKEALDIKEQLNQKLREREDELQKRVDDLTQVMEELLEEMKYPTATFEEVICSGVRELEQALNGGEA